MKLKYEQEMDCERSLGRHPMAASMAAEPRKSRTAECDPTSGWYPRPSVKS